MRSLESRIIKNLEGVGSYFKANELAYYALTTKIEIPLRDRWAYALYQDLYKEDFIVSREWRRVDLAVLKNKDPVALIELKAMYTFDAVRPKGNYKYRINLLREDAKRSSELADVANYTVLLATHPKAQVPSYLDKTVKYLPGINSAIKESGSAQRVKNIAISRVNEELVNENVLAQGELNGGESFGIPTSVLFWVIGN